jgi:hypothetical protein
MGMNDDERTFVDERGWMDKIGRTKLDGQMSDGITINVERNKTDGNYTNNSAI